MTDVFGERGDSGQDLESGPEERKAAPDRAYRRRIYSRYVSAFKGRPQDLEDVGARQRRREFFDHLLKPIPLPLDGESRRLLELGCGPGHLLEWATERGFQAHGIDLSAEQVAIARQRGLPAEIAEAEEYLARHPESYDCIVALDLIEHLDRDEVFRFLDGVRQSLRPGGRLLLTTPNAAGLRPGPVTAGDLTHETLFTPSTLEQVLHLCGFTDVKITESLPPWNRPMRIVRRILWGVVRRTAMVLDAIEQGSAKTRVLTRVMVCHARCGEAQEMSR